MVKRIGGGGWGLGVVRVGGGRGPGEGSLQQMAERPGLRRVYRDGWEFRTFCFLSTKKNGGRSLLLVVL